MIPQEEIVILYTSSFLLLVYCSIRFSHSLIWSFTSVARLKMSDCKTNRHKAEPGPTLLCFACYNFPAAYLFELRDHLPCGCRGDDGPRAPWI